MTGRRTLWAWMFAGVVVVLATAALPSSPDRYGAPDLRAAVDPAAGLRLTDDAGGAALFQVTNLAPGHPESSCVAVSYSDIQPSSTVLLYGSLTDPTLAPYLDTTIEVGTGGGYGSCGGFSPVAQVYGGTLAQFAADHHDGASGLPALQVAQPTGVATFRVTVEVQDNPAAQGKAGTWDLVWTAPVDDGDPAPVVTPPPTAPATPAPTPSAAPATPTPSAPASEEPSQAPSVEPSASQPTGGQGGRGGGSDDEAGGGRKAGSRSIFATAADIAKDVAAKVSEAVAYAAVPVARATSISVGAAVLVGLFISVQHRIDGRDPKLALAPVRAPEDLPFIERSTLS